MTKSSPLYAQLCDDIRMWISEQLYKVGDKLPTERELCEIYKISRSTVRRAFVELEKEGVISSRQGAGIFVEQAPLQQSLQRFYSFSDEMRRRGLTPGNRILSFQRMPASVQIRQQLECVKDSHVYRIVRLRLANDEPHLYETTYIPADIMPGFCVEQFENHDLYELMEGKFKIRLKSAKESFQAVNVNQVAAAQLGIKKNCPCIFFVRITRSNSGQIVELTESYGRGDKFLFEVEMLR